MHLGGASQHEAATTDTKAELRQLAEGTIVYKCSSFPARSKKKNRPAWFFFEYRAAGGSGLCGCFGWNLVAGCLALGESYDLQGPN